MSYKFGQFRKSQYSDYLSPLDYTLNDLRVESSLSTGVVFIDKGIVSASKIQSYYYCGYPRAVKIIQDLKSAGYVKDNNNPDIKYRWVLVKKDKEAITRIINEGLNR